MLRAEHSQMQLPKTADQRSARFRTIVHMSAPRFPLSAGVTVQGESYLASRPASSTPDFASVMGVLGFITAVYTVSATLRLRAGEPPLHAEPTLSASASQLRGATAHATTGSSAVTANGSAGLVHGWTAVRARTSRSGPSAR